MCSTTYAASFGHSRIVSALGHPLRIDVPVHQLTPDDLRSFNVTTAPAAAWAQAGLTPPVDLTSISLDLADGYTPGSKVIQLRSTEPFDKPVADLLLDVRTASGQQRYQVSLLTHASQDALRSAGGASPSAGVGGAAAQPGNQRMLRGLIRVKKGDTMFAIARRHAVRGVTVYQMMMALQRANPQAFIHGNINLVKAGASLAMPDMAGLTAISDKEARRLFAQQAQAFALYRQRLATSTSPVAQEGSASQGVVTSAAGQAAPAPAPRASEDQLRLSRGQTAPANSASGVTGASTGGGAASSSAGSAAGGGAGSPGANGSAAASSASNDADVRADDSVAARKQIDESKERVSQLEQNVKNLNQALQSQGGAATDLIVEGAKGLSQSLADVADAVTSPGGTDSAAEAAGANAKQGSAAGTAAGATATGSTGQSTTGAAAPGASGSGAAGAAGAAAAGATGHAATGASPAGGSTALATQGGAAGSGHAASNHGSGNAATAGSTAGGAAHGSTASGASSATAGGASADGSTAASPTRSNAPAPAGTQSAASTSAGSEAGGAPATESSATGSSASGSAGTQSSASGGSAASSAGDKAAGNASGAAGTAPGASLAAAGQRPGSAGETAPGSNPSKSSPGADRAGDVAEPVTTKAEQTVSWIQEHMLGVITALLALIVLVIAWLLRRANAGRDDGRDDNSGLITEAMVREKLDQINLDLSQSSADDTSARRR